MKTTIYELLGLIKDNKAPNNVIYKDKIFIYIEEEREYRNEEGDYLITNFDMLNDEIEIIGKPKEDKIEKLEFDFKMIDETDFVNKYPRISYMIETQKNMINKIIDKLNMEAK